MKKIRLGLIGCGGMMKRHAEGIQMLDNVEITAVCDVAKEKAEDVAAVIAKESLGDIVLLNQLDASSLAEAKRIASLLPCPVFAGSIALGKLQKV